MKPESLMMSHGYKPELSQGAVKCPIFLTSTFVFKSAEEGKDFFELAYGHRQSKPNEELGLIYSRINNPNLEILEDRLSLWDAAAGAAVFESGMSAISTVLLEFLKPGSLLLYSAPVYGGTHHFIHHVLTKFGIDSVEFGVNDSHDEIIQKIEASGKAKELALIYIETPANPTNDLFSILDMVALGEKYSVLNGNKVFVAVDNTYLGPLWQKPLKLGADITVYSATKYLGGHSDLIAGAVMGTAEVITRVKTLRTFLGNMISPHTAWMLLRSLETLQIRMERQQANAKEVALFLAQHPMVEKVYFLGEGGQVSAASQKIYQEQCSGPGAMISFDIKGNEQTAFAFLNRLNLFKLAVSLGSTESLAEHPATMTHVDIPSAAKIQMNITEKLIRLSIGVEDAKDLIADINQAMQH
ncbi:MAG: cystathionine gamma-synthase family protein [Flavobacteriales bacterium]